MERPSLSPNDVTVPACLAFSDKISPACLRTWIQIRSLAGGEDQTPPLSLSQISRIFGRSPSAIYAHFAQLRILGALDWRRIDQGRLVVTFDGLGGQNPPAPSASGLPNPPVLQGGRPPKPASPPPASSTIASQADRDADPYPPPAEGAGALQAAPLQSDDFHGAEPQGSKFQESGFPESGFLESEIPPSLNDLIDHDSEIKGLKREGKFQKLGFLDSKGHKQPPGRKFQKDKTESQDGGAADLYRSLSGIRPNAFQRAAISTEVVDLDRWGCTVEHWLSHGWNPRNILGMLDLYERGGPSGCIACRTKTKLPSPDPIQELEKKYGLK